MMKLIFSVTGRMRGFRGRIVWAFGVTYAICALTASAQPIEIISPNEESLGYFGRSVSGVGDVNGDGRGDVVVGAYLEDPGASPSNAGRAYIFSGSDGSLLWTLVSPNEQREGHFGRSVSGIPDVNGDGRGDVVVGASSEHPALSRSSPGNAGRAYIFSGSDGSLLWTLVSPNEQFSGFFGRSVSGIQDVNGDGRGDVVVGAFREAPGASPTSAGRAYVFSGLDGSLLWTLVSANEQAGGIFGHSVSGIPDVNGDDRGDVVVGAFLEDPGAGPDNAGRAYIFPAPFLVPFSPALFLLDGFGGVHVIGEASSLEGKRSNDDTNSLSSILEAKDIE